MATSAANKQCILTGQISICVLTEWIYIRGRKILLQCTHNLLPSMMHLHTSTLYKFLNQTRGCGSGSSYRRYAKLHLLAPNTPDMTDFTVSTPVSTYRCPAQAMCSWIPARVLLAPTQSAHACCSTLAGLGHKEPHLVPRMACFIAALRAALRTARALRHGRRQQYRRLDHRAHRCQRCGAGRARQTVQEPAHGFTAVDALQGRTVGRPKQIRREPSIARGRHPLPRGATSAGMLPKQLVCLLTSLLWHTNMQALAYMWNLVACRPVPPSASPMQAPAACRRTPPGA